MNDRGLVQGVRTPRLVRGTSLAANLAGEIQGKRLVAVLAPLARPEVAFAVALLVYLVRAHFSSGGWAETRFADFNWLADAFLHGQLHLRSEPPDTRDLIEYGGQL